MCLNIIQPDHVCIVCSVSRDPGDQKETHRYARPRGWQHNAMMVTVCPSI